MRPKAPPPLEDELAAFDPELRGPAEELLRHVAGFSDSLAGLADSLTALIAEAPERLDRIEGLRQDMPGLGAVERDLINIAGRAVMLLIQIQGLGDPGVLAARKEVLVHLAGTFEAAGKIVRLLVTKAQEKQP